MQWVNGKTGLNRKVKKTPSAVVDLTPANFDAVVNGDKAVFLEFYAPWCGHCKSLAPKYETFAKIFAGETDVVIAKVISNTCERAQSAVACVRCAIS